MKPIIRILILDNVLKFDLHRILPCIAIFSLLDGLLYRVLVHIVVLIGVIVAMLYFVLYHVQDLVWLGCPCRLLCLSYCQLCERNGYIFVVRRPPLSVYCLLGQSYRLLRGSFPCLNHYFLELTAF